MNTLNNFIVFSNDKNTLVLLQGYCFAKNITITNPGFTMATIREVAKTQPCLLVIPVNLLCSGRNALEVSSLKREVSKHEHLKICVINDTASDPVPPELSAWIDVVIHAPINLNELDSYLKTAFPMVADVAERRNLERRSYSDRRASETKDCNRDPLGNVKHTNEFGPHPPQHLGFHLDRPNKRLIVNTRKIELTPKEFELIELLLTDVDRIFMTEEIVQHLWPTNHRATKADLYQYMHLLRKKIEKDPNHPKWLMNIKGYGYKLNLSKIA